MTSQKNIAYIQALNYMSNEPNLNTLITWLCFTMHWPFHAAWLCSFIELDYQKFEYCLHKSKRLFKSKYGLMYHKHASKSEPEGLNRPFYEMDQDYNETEARDKDSLSTNNVQDKSKYKTVCLSPKLNFSVLHSRILKK